MTVNSEIKEAFLKEYPGYEVAFLCDEDADYMDMSQWFGWRSFRMFEKGWKTRESITVPIKQSLEQDIENPMIGMLPNLEEET